LTGIFGLISSNFSAAYKGSRKSKQLTKVHRSKPVNEARFFVKLDREKKEAKEYSKLVLNILCTI